MVHDDKALHSCQANIESIKPQLRFGSTRDNRKARGPSGDGVEDYLFWQRHDEGHKGSLLPDNIEYRFFPLSLALQKIACTRIRYLFHADFKRLPDVIFGEQLNDHAIPKEMDGIYKRLPARDALT